MPTIQAQSLEQFIDEQQALVQQREVDATVAYWDASMTSAPEVEAKAATAMADLLACYADPERYEALKSTPEPDEAHADLSRQRKLLLDDFSRHQMPRDVIEEISRREMEIDGLFSSYRAELRGREVSDNDLRDILKNSNNSDERYEAWRASKQIGGQVAGKLLELVEIRNREAKRLGYNNYYAMSMALQELDEDELFATLEEVSTLITPAFLRRKSEIDAQLAARFGVEVAELRPWHYTDPFFQEAPNSDEERLDALFAHRKLEDVLLAFFDALGLNVHTLLPLADLYEKPGKNQHAFCMSSGRGTGDVRVLCNLRPDAKWMSTLLHEFGHAVYDNELGSDLPFFLKSISHIMTTEAIAEMMGRFVTNSAWLRRWAAGESKPDGIDIDAVAGSAASLQRAQLLVFTQWVQVITHFERELYRDPKQDLGKLWWNLVAKYQDITPPTEDEINSDAWASKVHLATSPVYYHNYLMGEMIASQLLHSLRTEVVATEDELVASPKVGAWLIERVFQPGARYAWNDLVKHATGETLQPKYFVDEVSA